MPQPENKLLTAALDYAGRGWLVFPIYEPTSDHKCSCGDASCDSPAKHPRTSHGLKDATTNKAIIIGWWQKWPQASVGIATGKDSGLLVLDIDLYKPEGPTSKKKLEKMGNIPWTPTSHTGGGGEHFFMTYPNNGKAYRNKTALGGLEGIDIRGEGGYVIVHPSLHLSGKRYVWAVNHIGNKLAPPPTWFLDFINAQEGKKAESWKSSNGNSYWGSLWAGVSKGGRNDAATRLVGRLLGRGMATEEATAILQLWNRQNFPPLEDKELEAVIASINRSETQKPDRGAIVGADWLLSQPQEVIPEIISKGIFPEGEGVILTGEGGAGKSLLSLEMALRILKGLPIWNFEIPQPKRVLIIQTENSMGQVRFRLERLAYGLRISDFKGLNIVEPEFRADLANVRDQRKIIDKIEKSQAQVVILDPLISFHSKNENDNVQMRHVLDQLTAISRQTGVSWLLLHHHGKPGENPKDSKWGYRGASSIRDWARTMISLVPKTNNEKKVLRVLNFDKINFGPEQPSLILERNSFFLHEMTEENITVPFSLVAELLQDLGGQCKGRAPLAKMIMKEVSCSKSTAYRAIENAIDKIIHETDEHLILIVRM